MFESKLVHYFHYLILNTILLINISTSEKKHQLWKNTAPKRLKLQLLTNKAKITKLVVFQKVKTNFQNQTNLVIITFFS